MRVQDRLRDGSGGSCAATGTRNTGAGRRLGRGSSLSAAMLMERGPRRATDACHAPGRCAHGETWRLVASTSIGTRAARFTMPGYTHSVPSFQKAPPAPACSEDAAVGAAPFGLVRLSEISSAVATTALRSKARRLSRWSANW